MHNITSEPAATARENYNFFSSNTRFISFVMRVNNCNKLPLDAQKSSLCNFHEGFLSCISRLSAMRYAGVIPFWNTGKMKVFLTDQRGFKKVHTLPLYKSIFPSFLCMKIENIFGLNTFIIESRDFVWVLNILL